MNQRVSDRELNSWISKLESLVRWENREADILLLKICIELKQRREADRQAEEARKSYCVYCADYHDARIACPDYNAFMDWRKQKQPGNRRWSLKAAEVAQAMHEGDGVAMP